jgi:hypothetical protein
MTDYVEWQTRHPLAAAELHQILGAIPWLAAEGAEGKSEAWAQQHARLGIAQQGAMAWRNNVGATPARCKACGVEQQPVRYGLANDSQKLNAKIKSSDLILAIPRVITPAMVGHTIAQFGAVESKRPGWTYKGTEREVAQLAWLELIAKMGGFATFSMGEVKL